jgi:formylglycine-generating enzyme required for sulfatase activity
LESGVTTIPEVAPDKDVQIDMEEVRIEGGSYIPLYGRDSSVVMVEDFYVDRYPVSNQDYLKFVQLNTRWRKSKIPGLFADDNYLISWPTDTSLAPQMLPNAAVTNVSWFAANAYCECQGKRLPLLDEWEYIAMANESLPDARKLEEYNQQILDWYERPKTYNQTMGQYPPNYWGVNDLHGLVWEWTSDFNSVLISGESRKDGSLDRNLFCGSAAVGASDLMNYAAFMRYAFRGSIKAKYSIKNLGFRCVRDVKTN